jgi:hypothetical protein
MDPPDINNDRRGGRLRELKPAGKGPSFVRREPHVAPDGGGRGRAGGQEVRPHDCHDPSHGAAHGANHLMVGEQPPRVRVREVARAARHIARVGDVNRSACPPKVVTTRVTADERTPSRRLAEGEP